MTQVAEPGNARAESRTTARISHWIGGRIVAGTSGREGPVYDPATGQVTKYVDFASVGRGRGCGRGGEGGFPGLAGDLDLEADRRHVPHPQRRRGAPHGARGTAHRRARQGPVGRARRDRPRAREPRVRVRHPEPAQGRVLRAGVGRRRRLPDPPAARRRGRHHPVQLPGDGADVDVRDGDRGGQHVRAQAVGEGPVGGQLPGRAAARRGRPRRRLQRRPRRQGRGRRHPRAPRHRGGLVRRLDADRALHLRDRHQGRQAGPGARWRQEPHDRAARRRHRHGRRRRRLGRLRLGRGAVHGDRDDRGRRRRGRPAGRGDQGAPAQDRRGAGQRSVLRDGSAGDEAASRQGRLVPRLRAGPGRHRRGRRPRAPALRRVRTASSSACR